MSDLVFMDTETLGLHLDSPIWEFAAIRRSVNTGAPGCIVETELHMFIHHDLNPWFDELPAEFQADYTKRFDGETALEQNEAAYRIHEFLADRPHIVGAVPNFDTERISHQLLHPNWLSDPWHYHLIDVENVAVGYLASRGELLAPPWKSDQLSAAIGVDPERFDRHTAMGDVLWIQAQWDAVMRPRR